MQWRLMDRNPSKDVDGLSSRGPQTRIRVTHCPAHPPRRNKAVFYGMGVWFRGSGLVGYIVHAQSTVHLEFIKGYRCVYRADNDEMLGPLLRRWGGGVLAVLRQLVSNP